MRRNDIFPSKYMKPEDLDRAGMTLTIARCELEKLKSRDGTEQKKLVLYFLETEKALPLNRTNFDACAEICGSDETNDWVGRQIELFPTKTPMGGQVVACIRVRRPSKKPPAKQPPDGQPPDGEPNDEIPF
jgi:hypothetical protein